MAATGIGVSKGEPEGGRGLSHYAFPENVCCQAVVLLLGSGGQNISMCVCQEYKGKKCGESVGGTNRLSPAAAGAFVGVEAAA